MHYQTFRGTDMKEALEQVKASLGADAIIESARHVSNGKEGGLQHRFVEVRAGVPGASRSGPFSAEIASANQASSGSAPARTSSPRIPRFGLRRMDFQQPAPATSTAASPALTRDIDQELRALREMVEELRATRKPKERALAMLHEAGFEGAIARELAKGSYRAARQGNSELREWVVTRIAARLTTQPGLIARPGRQLVTCVGPSGAGKTTTLAKLAARAKLDHSRSVGIISLDTYRVGAVEQWQRYAQLLGIPFAIARAPEDFVATVASSTCDLLLVDTSGRAMTERKANWVVPECLARVPRYAVNALLVLPAWLRSRDAQRVVEVYSDAPVSGAVITKIDETGHRGGVVQSIIANSLPLTYTCDGPRVPEDIRDAASDTVLNGLLAVDA